MKNYLNKIFNSDCLSLMQQIPGKSIDLILTDPPYGIDFNKGHGTYNRDDSKVLAGYVEIEKNDYLNFSRKWIQAASVLLKDTGSFYIISGHTNLEFVLTAAREAGLTLKDQIIWKYSFGVYTSKKYVVSHYNILFFCKEPKKVKFYGSARHECPQKSYNDRIDVWEINRENWKGCLKTPTNLPRALIQKIIEYSSIKGDVVFDPFLGSGQTAFVANELGRKYLGCEVAENYYRFSKKRLDSGEYLIKTL